MSKKSSSPRKAYNFWVDIGCIFLIITAIMSFFRLIDIKISGTNEVASTMTTFNLAFPFEIAKLGGQTYKTSFSFPALLIEICFFAGLILVAIASTVGKLRKQATMILSILGALCMLANGILMFFGKDLFLNALTDATRAVFTTIFTLEPTPLLYISGASSCVGGAVCLYAVTKIK